MKSKTIIPLVIGLGVGFFAIKMGIDMVRKAKGEQSEQVMVAVAQTEIGVATRISEKMFVMKEVPENLVPKGAFKDAKELVGRVTRMTIPGGIALGSSMLAPKGATPGLAAKIPSGLRAVSVKVNEASSVAGFVRPSSRVDVYSSIRGRGRGMPTRSELILSDVEVGAVGQSMSEVAADGKTVMKFKSVTLFLKSDQVPVLDAATTRGNVRLALRSAGEPRVTTSFWSSLLDRTKSAAMQAAVRPAPVRVVAATPRRPRGHIVEVLHGSHLERLRFDDNGQLVRGSSMRNPSTSGGAAGPLDENSDDESFEDTTELDE